MVRDTARNRTRDLSRSKQAFYQIELAVNALSTLHYLKSMQLKSLILSL